MTPTDPVPPDLDRLADELTAASQQRQPDGCCSAPEWRNHLCMYHDGYMDGAEAAVAQLRQEVADRDALVDRLRQTLTDRDEEILSLEETLNECRAECHAWEREALRLRDGITASADELSAAPIEHTYWIADRLRALVAEVAAEETHDVE